MYGLYSRAAYNQERVMMARVRYIVHTYLEEKLRKNLDNPLNIIRYPANIAFSLLAFLTVVVHEDLSVIYATSSAA